MATVVRGLVEGIGIADALPTNPQWFTEITVPETVTIPCQKPDMEQLISVAVDAQVISVRVAHTPVNVTSPEGQHLSGCKLIVELKLRQKIKYVADEPTQSVHAAHFENVLQSIFVVVPCDFTISGITHTIEELLRLGLVKVTPYIEDIYGKMVDKKTVFKNIAILLDVEIKLPSIDMEKLVSADRGVTFVDADTIPGPIVPHPPNDLNPIFRFVVTNTGSVTLTGVSVVDSVLGTIAVPTTTLAPGQSFFIDQAGIWVVGEHANQASAFGHYKSITVSDSDLAHYLGLQLP